MSVTIPPVLRAQMALRDNGAWWVYVCADEWPTHTFTRTGRVPTVTERAAALAALGFEPVPGAQWSWSEDAREYGDPSSPVVLITATTVRPLGGAA
ncbi:hypothetical protein KUM39_27845 [Streptomyces sp. J2-1]|uniref:DUF6303 family protein n=1 Tax=Streptomyces corallincola TaxID=2851888 RepID=UPI001C380FC1|nr:DUF6303 family protein [Streptomyces corallincola]MBV2358112.1 hypothetical protein [Streptomyces corallincola]